MFDTTAPLTIGLGAKECRVRWPTDREWLAWIDGQRYKVSRRGVKLAHCERRCEDLFRVIRLDTGPSFSAAEAASVIETLDASELVRLNRAGAELRVEIAALGETTQHLLRLPTVHDLVAHREAVLRVNGARRNVRSVAPTGALYDHLHLSHAGYVGAVPLVHKVAIIADVIERISNDPQTFEVHLIGSI